jgi:hypothetical protein
MLAILQQLRGSYHLCFKDGDSKDRRNVSDTTYIYMVSSLTNKIQSGTNCFEKPEIQKMSRSVQFESFNGLNRA